MAGVPFCIADIYVPHMTIKLDLNNQLIKLTHITHIHRHKKKFLMNYFNSEIRDLNRQTQRNIKWKTESSYCCKIILWKTQRRYSICRALRVQGGLVQLDSTVYIYEVQYATLPNITIQYNVIHIIQHNILYQNFC